MKVIAFKDFLFKLIFKLEIENFVCVNNNTLAYLVEGG